MVEREYGIAATAEQIAETVARLVQAKLILPIDERLVGLAVNGAGGRIPAEFPGGRIRQSMLRSS